MRVNTAEQKIITVSQLNRYVRSLIESNPHLNGVLVCGEISNFKRHSGSGHLYMSLKDENAVVRAVMFHSSAARLKFEPENGMKVIVRARVSLYERDGSYQLYIDDMQPDGIGALQVAFEQLKAKLAAEGLFDEKRKKPLPKYPEAIGVITSPTGAAVRDILNILSRRYPLARVVLVPVLVQGEGAPPQLIAALQRLNQLQAVDVIIIGRGGGSIEDLWAFNDEGVARAVAASRIPVISAVGHETDFTICDFVADMRAPTPSAAAELATPDRNKLLRDIITLQQRAQAAMGHMLVREQKRLEALRGKRCLATPLFYVEEQRMRLDYLTSRFVGAAQMITGRADRRLAAAAGKLDALSPLKVLSRGYAIATVDGHAVDSVEALTIGQAITLRLSDGEADCQVKEIRKEEVNHGKPMDI